MAKTKNKLAEQVEFKKKKAPLLLNPQAEAHTEKDLTSEEFWKEEIESLSKTRFRTLEEALDELINRAISKGSFASEDIKVKEFIKTAFLETPELVKDLKDSLQIGNE